MTKTWVSKLMNMFSKQVITLMFYDVKLWDLRLSGAIVLNCTKIYVLRKLLVVFSAFFCVEREWSSGYPSCSA